MLESYPSSPPISGLCLYFEIFASGNYRTKRFGHRVEGIELFSGIAESEGRILVDAPVESGTAREKLDGKIRG